MYPSIKASTSLTSHRQVASLEEQIKKFSSWRLWAAAVLNDVQIERDGMPPLFSHFGINLNPEVRDAYRESYI